MYPLKATPFNYQVKGMNFAWEHHYCLIGDEMGLGKTLQAIGVAVREDKQALVVVPTFLKNNWKREFEKFAPDFKKWDVIGYTEMKKNPLLFRKAKVIIADEAHYLKNEKAQRTNYFTEAVEQCKPIRLVLLTGTPIKNRIPEFYTLLYLLSLNPLGTSGLDIRKYFRSQWKFNEMFCNKSQFRMRGRTITKWNGSRNVGKLKELLNNKFIRRLGKNEIELPELLRKDVYLKSYSRENPELAEQWMKFQGGKGLHSSTAKKEAAEITAVSTAEYCISLLEEGEGPLVVFSDHPGALRILRNILLKKYKVGAIDGSVNVDDRQAIADKLGNGLDTLLCTIGATSVGFNLVAASNLIFNDMSWVPGDNKQAEKRIHRIGQEKKSTIHRMIGSPIQEKITASLTAKMDDINEVYE